MVTAWGYDEGLAQAQDYAFAIISAAVEGNHTRVLCNEFDLEYRLRPIDTYEAATFISANAPKIARIAIVCNPKFGADARFFEDVAVNRGLMLRFFWDADASSQWLHGADVAT